MKIYEGQRVVTKQVVVRYPHFVCPEMKTGTVISAPKERHGTIYVKMDEVIEGCEPWDNRIQCHGHDDFDALFADLMVAQLESAVRIVGMYVGGHKPVLKDCLPWLKTTAELLKAAGSEIPLKDWLD